MNNALVDKLAGYFAQRIWKETQGDARKGIEQAFWTALSRPPTQEEKKVSLEAFNRFTAASRDPLPEKGSMPALDPEVGPPDQQPGDDVPKALENFCHALLNSGAFIYID
jgi:hypothetical protein